MKKIIILFCFLPLIVLAEGNGHHYGHVYNAGDTYITNNIHYNINNISNAMSEDKYNRDIAGVKALGQMQFDQGTCTNQYSIAVGVHDSQTSGAIGYGRRLCGKTILFTIGATIDNGGLNGGAASINMRQKP